MSVLTEFLESGFIPGAKNVSDSNATPIVRILWLGVILTSFVCGIIVMSDSFSAWNSDPILVTLDSFDAPLSSIHYPTVTICPVKSKSRWAIARHLFNTVAFPCGEASSASKEGSQTKATSIDVVLGSVIEDILERVTLLFQLNEEMGTIHINPVLTTKVENFLALLESQHPEFLTEFESRLVKAPYCEYKVELPSSLGTDDLLEALNKNNDSFATPETEKKHRPLARKTAFFLVGLQAIKSFGEHLATAIQMVDEVGGALRDSFMLSADHVYSDVEEAFLEACNVMFKSFTNDSETFISLFEIPAMLERTRFSPESIRNLSMASKHSYWYSARSAGDINWREQPNFFGKSLSKYKEVVLRLMAIASSALLNPDLEPLPIPYPTKEPKPSRSDKKRLPEYITSASFCESCSPQEQEEEDLEFLPVVADEGICSAFNAMPIHEALAPVRNSTLLKILATSNHQFKFVASGGSWGRLKIHLKTSMLEVPSSGPSFRLGVQNSHDFIDTISDGVDIDIGHKYLLKVVPVQYVTSDDFRDLPVSVRKCRYADENPRTDSVFSYYSKKTCTLECLLTKSAGITGCVPWYFPVHDESMDFCDGYQTHVFIKAAERVVYHECHCLPDCEEVTFRYTVSSEKLDGDLYCLPYATDMVAANNARDLGLSEARKHARSLVNFMIVNMLEEGGNYTINATDFTRASRMAQRDSFLELHEQTICRAVMQNNLAEIAVEISVPTLSRIKKQRKATFSDKLASLGNQS